MMNQGMNNEKPVRPRSIKINAILNGTKTLFSLIFPLISIPYVTRVLGVENLGKYNFCLSISNYFSLLASLGVSTYAIREGSQYRNNKEKINRFTSEILSINLVSTVIAYFVLWALLLLVPRLRQDKSIILILSSSIIFVTVGCEWVFSIYEDYLFLTLRTIGFQLCSLILLFVLVHNRDDVRNYAFVTAISSILIGVTNTIARRKYVTTRVTISRALCKHIKPILILFTSNVATILYVNSDVTMLGFLSSEYHIGLYSVSTKVYSLFKQILSAIIIVSIPRLSFLVINNVGEYKKLCRKIINVLILCTAPIITGIFIFSGSIIKLIAGGDFSESVPSLRILSIALMFCVIGWFYTSCVLIPKKDEGKVLKITLIAAIVNIGINFFLIPLLHEVAAALTTMIAELISMVLSMMQGYKYTGNILEKRNVWTTLIADASIILISCVIRSFGMNYIIELMITVFLSALSYCLILYMFHNEIFLTYCTEIKYKLGK